MNKIVEIRALCKSYGKKHAISDLDLDIYEKEIIGIVGPNGAGKTTSIECILGVQKRDSGEVSVLGMDPLSSRKRLFQQVGVQLQETSYQDKIKVKEICETKSSYYKSVVNWRELLKRFGLIGKEKAEVNELSGGERQRLSVLLSLLHNPKLVFLDELTTGLDTKARREIWRFLLELKENGLTIVLSSHYMDEIEVLCDKLCILNEGRTVIYDTVKNVVGKSPYKTLEDAYLWYTNNRNSIEVRGI